ncbi:hypothetical protein [Saccharopolyspora sp. NPDC002686]|uniref:hypothetical protein n=1 Tax=Saccharopolyspora sp. NPDC002686 TaxID=3154541 RepID=UPI00331EDEC5
MTEQGNGNTFNPEDVFAQGKRHDEESDAINEMLIGLRGRIDTTSQSSVNDMTKALLDSYEIAVNNLRENVLADISKMAKDMGVTVQDQEDQDKDGKQWVENVELANFLNIG